ncbi:MAG: Crp/Fnr family transcriptional regulator [Proteobacteria bacterium]|nr:Crp/Fnr family transcriptional regulator [Pseudomonadota bacterium]
MKSGLSLHERRRLLTDSELQSVPWLAHLLSDERDRIVPELRVSEAAPGDLVCRIGRPATYWFGVIDGLLKMNTVTDDGRAITYSGLAAGGWFGEGTVLKRESYRYNIQALRKSRVAGLPVDTFHWLLDQSIGFNRFVMNQLNERLSQFIGVVGAGRSASPEQRVARNLAALVNPVLFPGVGEVLRITQQELAYLAGLSRQRVNEALRTLQERGVLRIEYGGLRIVQAQALRRADF